MDSLRAIAALGVLFGHVGGISRVSQDKAYGAWVANLTVGVCLFFVLSGFLLYRPFVNGQFGGAPRPRVWDYARRRVLRIIPAYWVALTLLALYPGLEVVHGPDWWRFYGLLQIYTPLYTLAGISVAWSLCIEASFYVALPFFALGVGRLTRHLSRPVQVCLQLGLLAVLSVASVALRARNEDVVLANSLPTYFFWFALGMALAVLSAAWHDDPRAPRVVRLVAERPGTCWAIALVVYLALGAAMSSAPNHTGLSHEQAIVQHVLRGGVAFFLVLPAVFGDNAGGWPRRVLSWRVLAWLGLISYGIYLWHLSVAQQLFRELHLGAWPLLVGTIALSTAIAAASYYVVERPILRFKDWRPRRRRAPEAESRVATPV